MYSGLPLIVRVQRLGCWLFRFVLSKHVEYHQCKCCLFMSFPYAFICYTHTEMGRGPSYLSLLSFCDYIYMQEMHSANHHLSPISFVSITPGALDNIVGVYRPYWHQGPKYFLIIKMAKFGERLNKIHHNMRYSFFMQRCDTQQH